ncbi:MAG: hypothetical protein AAF682_21605 [Planctomycetota bacterium]
MKLPLATALLAYAAPLANAQETLVETGMDVPGLGEVGIVTDVEGEAGEGWLAQCACEDGQALIRDGAAWVKAGDPLPQPAGAAFLVGRGLFDEQGRLAWSALYGNLGQPGSGLYFEGTALRWSGAPCAAPEAAPGTTYAALTLTDVAGPGTSAVVAELSEGGSANAAVVLLRVDGAGALASESIALRAGDQPPGLPAPIAGFGEVAVNAQEDVLAELEYAGPGGVEEALCLNDALLARTGEAAPVAGSIWLALGSPRLNDAGQHAYQGTLTDGVSAAWALVRDGALFAREGDVLADVAPYALVDPLANEGSYDLAGDGRLVWIGRWSAPADNVGLFVDETLYLQAGVSQVNGRAVASFGAPYVDPGGQTVSIQLSLDDGTTGAYRFGLSGSVIEIPGCTSIPGALKQGGGSPAALDTLVFELDQAQSVGAISVLAVSIGPAVAPCGAFVPGIGEVLIDLAPPSPALSLGGPQWPGGPIQIAVPVPPETGVTLAAQGLFLDPAAFGEPIRLTNALEILVGL